jgi:PHD/YefM family antitoxin component YafN of YafNO toxin-antitoxin module
MDIISASEARARLYNLVNEDVAVQETLHLLSLSGMRESINAARAEPLAESSRELCW